MKLYFKAGACSLSPHIALIEAGLPFTSEAVDLATKKLASGGDFTKINPKGQVPTLQLDNGEILTEGAVIVQYIADQAPASNLAPANGTLERVRLQEWLNFIATELHKGVGSNFNAKLDANAKQVFKDKVAGSFDWLSNSIKGPYLMGDTFTVADGYLFNILSWLPHIGMDLKKWPVLQAYFDRVASRPAVQKAMMAEGLIKAAA